MIEETLYAHLQVQEDLRPFLTTYAGKMAIFNQEAPADTDANWTSGPQYGRIIFYVDMGDDPERTYSGTLSVDVQCKQGAQVPEEIEPIIRSMIDGYFFSVGTETMAAQWNGSNYFTEPTDDVCGVTLTFSLLAFPMITTTNPNIVERFNRWTKETFPQLSVIGYDELTPVWKPTDQKPAVYWRLYQVQKCGWIPDTYQTDWKTAVLKGHVLAPSVGIMTQVSQLISETLTTKRRILKDGESPFMVDRNNSVFAGADPMRTGQITCEATYGVIKPEDPSELMNHIFLNEKECSNGNETRRGQKSIK